MSSRIETPPAPTSARWTTSAALILGWALVVVLLLYVLELRPRMRTEAPNVDTVPTAEANFPAPPEGAVVYSRQMGSDALALGVLPETGRVVVQASVVGPDGEGVSGLDVKFGAQGSTATGRSCGAGCYRRACPPSERRRRLRSSWTGTRPPAGASRFPRAGRRSTAIVWSLGGSTWRSLRSLSFDETLRSDETPRADERLALAGA